LLHVAADQEEEMRDNLEVEEERVEWRAPSPGLAAVFSVVIPGLGQVYSGRLLAGGLWFLTTSFSYWAILIPGILVHGVCVWSAYQSARRWVRY
jgi:TM2 domain-containing membrane protein YozV